MPKHEPAGAGGSTLLGIEERKASATGGSSALDRWLTRRILAESGHPPLVIELWDGTRFAPAHPAGAAPEPVARVEIRDRRTLYGLLVNSDVAFGGRGEPGPHPHPRRPRHLPRDHLPVHGRRGSARFLEAAPEMVDQPAAPQHPVRLPVQHPPPLRFSATTSTGSGSTRRWCTRARTSRTRTPPSKKRSGPRWTTCAASSSSGPGRASSRRGCGWGFARGPHGARVRRERPGVQQSPTSRFSTRANGRPHWDSKAGSSSWKTTTAPSRASTTSLSRSVCWSTWGSTTTGPSARWRPGR